MILRAPGLILILALSILAAPVSVDAQQPAKVVRIGVLSPLTPAAVAHYLEAFRQGLRELGYMEGKNVILERLKEGSNGSPTSQPSWWASRSMSS